MEILIIFLLIIGITLGLLVLKKFKLYIRIIIVLVIGLILYFFSFLLAILPLVISSSNYNILYGIVVVLAMSFLMPSYCFCINKYKDSTSDIVISLIVTTVLFEILVSIVSVLIKVNAFSNFFG